MRYKISWRTVLSGLRRKLRRLQSIAPGLTTLARQFLAARSEIFSHRGNIYLPPPSYQKPHFHCSSLLSKFKPSLLLTGSSASSPATLLLAAPPPRRLPFFLQRRLLAGDPSSCSAASSPATLLLAAQPPRRRPFFLLRGLVDMVR